MAIRKFVLRFSKNLQCGLRHRRFWRRVLAFFYLAGFSLCKVTGKKGSATQPNLPSRATSGSSAIDPNRAVHRKLARTSLFSGYFPAFFPGWPNFPEFFRFQTGCRISCFFKHRPELIWGKDRKPYTACYSPWEAGQLSALISNEYSVPEAAFPMT